MASRQALKKLFQFGCQWAEEIWDMAVQVLEAVNNRQEQNNTTTESKVISLVPEKDYNLVVLIMLWVAMNIYIIQNVSRCRYHRRMSLYDACVLQSRFRVNSTQVGTATVTDMDERGDTSDLLEQRNLDLGLVMDEDEPKDGDGELDLGPVMDEADVATDEAVEKKEGDGELDLGPVMEEADVATEEVVKKKGDMDRMAFDPLKITGTGALQQRRLKTVEAVKIKKGDMDRIAFDPPKTTGALQQDDLKTEEAVKKKEEGDGSKSQDDEIN